MLFIEEKLYEKINERIPTAAIWEFINHYWDMNAAVSFSESLPILFKFIY